MDQPTEPFGSVFVFGMGLALLVLGMIVGFVVGRKGRLAPESLPEVIDKKIEETDDPTAPIMPMVQMGRSPHDRHRDLAVGNSVVKSIEWLELVLKSGDRQTKETILEQLDLVKNDFHGLLSSCSFRAFDYQPGTVIDGAMRARIKIVEGSSGEQSTRIVRTIRCGFYYEPGGDEEPVLIRKAEVEIG